MMEKNPQGLRGLAIFHESAVALIPKRQHQRAPCDARNKELAAT